ncbi:MAG: DUF58 domain-containing protein [Acidimicrobiales bacterium]
MLTRQGWLVTAGAVVLVAAGRLLGVFELFVLGVAAAALVGLTFAVVLLVRLRLEVARHLSPPRVHAGTPSRVELRLRNRGERSTPVLRLFDPVSGTRGADLHLAPLEPLGTAQAAYRLPTDRRGIIRVGPLEVVVDDPFGLASVRTIAAPRTELTVYPRIDAIVPVPYTSGHDPHAGAEHPTALGRTGEDFYALRQYVLGDDIRRVHWPSTARRDELMVRQDELPWQGRVVVLLDVRRSTHTAASLELAVSAAASVVTASWQRQDLVRMLSTDGADSGFAAGTAHVEAIMEHLATVQATPGGTFKGMVESFSQSRRGGGGLVAVVADVTEPELTALARLRASFGSVTIVQFDRSSWDRAAPAPAVAPSLPGLVKVTGQVAFADAWNRAMQGRGRLGRRLVRRAATPGAIR